MGLHEVCINWSDFKASQTLASFLRAKAENIPSVASHNKRGTENINRYQRGGTATIIREQLAAFMINSSINHTRIGRRPWYQVEGEPGHRTYLITVYMPCGNVMIGKAMVYKQQERFIQERKGLKTNQEKCSLKVS